MHLWPSTMIRDSFKFEFLKKVEWNKRRRINREKQQSSANQHLLEKQVGGDGDAKHLPSPKSNSGFSVFFRDSLMILSCCCCCLCCGAPVDEEAQ